MKKRKSKKATLHIYWNDGCTVELRDFFSREGAEEYAKKNGCVDYYID